MRWIGQTLLRALIIYAHIESHVGRTGIALRPSYCFERPGGSGSIWRGWRLQVLRARHTAADLRRLIDARCGMV